MIIIYRYLILLFVTLSSMTFSQNFWERISSPTENFLRTLHFADSLRGWVAGDSGVIFYTSDGGLNWTQQQSNTTNKIMRLFFLDNNRAWALAWADAGDNLFYGTEILKTTDGGENWTVAQYREENTFMRGIYFLDTLKGFMGGVPGEFLVTTDGGENWESANIDSGAFSNFPVIDFKFYNSLYGFACGGRFDIAGVIWRTTNGGVSWTPIDGQYAPADEIWDIHFFDSLNVMAIGGDPDLFGVGILQSTDAGISWEYFEIGIFGQALALSYRTENEGWAVVPQAETFVTTFDYGMSWTSYCISDGSKLYDIVFTDSLTGYAVGEEGSVFKYTYRPIISNVKRNIVEVGFGVPVSVTAEVVDLDGVVTEVNLYYRKNYGEYNELTMTLQNENIWQATIPAQNDSTLIDFFIKAIDNKSYVSLSPKDTTFNNYFYLVIDRPLTIQDVQFSPFGSGYSFNCEFEGGLSGYNRYEVTVRGIVTADTTDIEGNETGIISGPQVYIQNGNGPWSGIKIAGDAVLGLTRGDDVSVTGIVNEDFKFTEIIGIDSPSQINVHSTGNHLPEPEFLSTATIDRLANGTMQAEQWEGVLIMYNNVVVNNENADGYPGPHLPPNNNYGDILVSDTSNSVTRITLQYGTHDYHNFWVPGLDTIPGLIRIKTGDTLEVIRGILFYSSGNYKLIPRKDDDFGKVSNVVSETNLPIRFQLFQNYPNPFNNSTNINFELPEETVVTLKIFNILGEEVSTLLNKVIITAGKSTIRFDANHLTSGIYFYKLQTSSFTRVMKMILLK